jgi:hypothetical protein
MYILNASPKYPYPKPFPLEGKGLYALVRKVLPFKGKDLGCGALISYSSKNNSK